MAVIRNKYGGYFEVSDEEYAKYAQLQKDFEKKQASIKASKEEATKRQMNLDQSVIDNNEISIGGALSAFRQYLRDNGIDDEVFEQQRQLLAEHSGYHYADADRKIVDALKSGSELGRSLELRIKYEEAMYKAWIGKHKNDPEPWRRGIFNGEKQIYRKGDRKSGVEPWTVNQEGANMGGGGIGYNHKSTVEQLMREGYHILGGIGMHLGSPGEGEITMIKY